jgi:hypothetical protein
MNDLLIKRLKTLAASRGSDSPADWWESGLPPPASERELEEEERLLGLPLHPLHRRLLREVANGGFGPGYGLIGAGTGMADSRGRRLAELRRSILNEHEARAPIVPLIEWGSGTWAFCDVPSGDVLSVADSGIVRIGLTLEQWLDAWCRGEKLAERLFLFKEQSVINPFTKARQVVRLAGGLAGTPYQP